MAVEIIKPTQASDHDNLVSAYETPDVDTIETPIETSSAAPKSRSAPAADQNTPPAKQLPPRDESGKFLSPSQVTGEPDEQRVYNHPRWLAQAAADVGMSQEEIETTPTDHLGPIVTRSQRLAHQQMREENRQQTVANSRERQDAQPLQNHDRAAPPEEVSPLADFDFGKNDDGTPIKEENYDTGIMKLFRQMKKEIQELRGHVQELSTREVNRENQTTAQRIDRIFQKTADPRFGEGAGHTLDANSAEYARRCAVLNEGLRLAGPKSTVEERLKKIPQAIKNLFGENTPGDERIDRPQPSTNGAARRARQQPVDEDQAAWEAAGLARPTQRIREPEPKGQKKAERAVAKRLAESVDNGDGEDFDIDEDFL